MIFIIFKTICYCQTNNKSITRQFTWVYDLPSSYPKGPLDVTVRGEYYFKKESLGDRYFVRLHCKILSLEFNPVINGTLRYKFNGKEYRQDQLDATDQKGSYGFDQIRITSMRASIDVSFLENSKTVSIGDGIPYEVGDIDKDADLNKLNLELAGSRLTYLNWDGSIDVEQRILNLSKPKVTTPNYNSNNSNTNNSSNSTSNNSNNSNSKNSSYNLNNSTDNNSSNSFSSTNETNSASSLNGANNSSSNTNSNQNYGGSGKNNLSDKVMVQGVGYVQVYEQNGQYYMQREDGSSHVTSLEAYNSVQSTASKNKAIRDQNAKIQNDQKVAQQREIDRVNAHNENLLLENEKRIDNINRATDHLVSSFYTMQNINNLKSDVDANRTLGSNFKSIEEIEQAFNQKYSGLSQSMDNMHAEEQNLNLNTLNYMSTLEGDAGTTGTIVAGGLYLLNEFQNQKEKENAVAELQRQRSEALAELERQKHQQLVDLRMEMLTTFPEGGIPLSSHKINVSEIYFFIYSLDESQITGQQPTVQVSNVFPWKKYTDGTWPYRTALDAELKNKGLTNKTTLVGFYSSQEMAEEMRSAYLKLAEMGKMRVENVALVGKPLNAAGGTNTKTANQTTDFWGEPTTPSSTKQQAAPKQAADDFWGEPVKPEAGSSTKGKTSTQPATTPKKNTNTEDDFWGAPVKQEPAKTTPAKPAPAKTTPAKPATPAKSNTPANNEKDFWGEPIKTTNEKKKP